LCKHGQACPAENFGTPDTWFFGDDKLLILELAAMLEK
jgi:hypothetical protein